MKTISEYLEEQINEGLKQAVLSGSRGQGPSKVKIRPVELKGQVFYQASALEGTRVFHKNYTRDEILKRLWSTIFPSSRLWDKRWTARYW